MNERQHHLNESSSARLGRSQKLEIMPSPNSKQTQSLGANFLMDALLWRLYLIGAEILTSVLFLSYICGAVILQFRTALPHTFAAYICPLYFELMFAAYICRQHLPHTFAGYILEVRLHFEQAPIFYTCANILGKCQYFNDFCNNFLLNFVAASICVYFQYLFMHFCVRQYFLRNCFEA